MSESPSETIDTVIDELGDWRGEMLAHVRDMISRPSPTRERSVGAADALADFGLGEVLAEA